MNRLRRDEIQRMRELAQDAVGADPEVVIEGDRNAVKFLFYLSPERILALCGLALSSLDQGWRDVLEELPKNTNYVLVFSHGEYMDTCFWNSGEWWMNGGIYNLLVTHWRELPKGPAVDGETH